MKLLAPSLFIALLLGSAGTARAVNELDKIKDALRDYGFDETAEVLDSEVAAKNNEVEHTENGIIIRRLATFSATGERKIFSTTEISIAPKMIIIVDDNANHKLTAKTRKLTKTRSITRVDFVHKNENPSGHYYRLTRVSQQGKRPLRRRINKVWGATLYKAAREMAKRQ